ncbi:MAG: aldolase/citrate lyase family protein [Thermodesulfobacteriota bacterium]|nr:aldolase/citrate lyase family protein [Thermodesulfobacteriota bacterium]
MIAPVTMEVEKWLPVSLDFKMLKRTATIGSWITMAHPAVAEIMAKAGFDWLVIDMEHSAITPARAEELIRVINLCGLPAFARVGKNDPVVIKHVMDSGASGVVVPMVNTPLQAEKAVAAVKYPPSGERGVGLSRAQFYSTFFEPYKRWVDQKSSVIVQIEHIDAVNNIDAILAVDGVDGFIVGPYDLSASLGIPGQFDHPEFIAANQTIHAAIASDIKPGGFHVVQPDAVLAKEKLNGGYRFLALGIDFLFLGNACRSEISQLRETMIA